MALRSTCDGGYACGGGVLPVDDVLNVLLGDVEPVAVPHCALQEYLDGDGQFLYPGIFQLVDVVIAVLLVVEG